VAVINTLAAAGYVGFTACLVALGLIIADYQGRR